MIRIHLYCSVLSTFLMLACSSSDSDDGAAAAGGGDTRSARARFEGTWLRELCTTISSGFVKEYWVISGQSDTTLTVASGQKRYADATCSSGETDAGMTTEVGTFAFDSTENAEGISFNRGDWTSVIGTTPVIWALNATGLLCNFADNESLANAGTVAAYTKIIEPKLCYRKL